MATIWKGAINFGLINVPVKLLPATSGEGVTFKTLHKECNTPIEQRRYCRTCQAEVKYEDTVKGYELEKDLFVPVTAEEIKSVSTDSARYINIVDFIKLSEIDPIYYKKSYFLSPEGSADKPYTILYEAMKQMEVAAISTVAIREKEHLCVVRVFEDILMLNTMYFENEVKPIAEVSGKIKRPTISPAELSLAKQIVQNLTTEFNPAKYEDNYNKQLLSLITAKAEGGKIPKVKHEPKNVGGDLFERLKASVEATAKPKGKKTKPIPKQKSSQDYLAH